LTFIHQDFINVTPTDPDVMFHRIWLLFYMLFGPVDRPLQNLNLWAIMQSL